MIGIIFRRILFKIKLFFIMSIILITIFTIIFIMQFEKHFIPTANLFSEKYAVNVISNKINESVQEVVENLDIYNLNFFENYSNEDGNINYININNVLINNICAEISNTLSDKLTSVKESKISLPLGNLTGIGIFSNFGPNFNIYISSVGNATVDYETKFENVGINQLNFQVWLNIDTQMTLINSLYSKDINVKRTLMLVNIVFNGDVPNNYINFDDYSNINS